MSWLSRIFAPFTPAAPPLPSAPSGPYRAKKREVTVNLPANPPMSREEYRDLNLDLQSANKLSYEGSPLKVEAHEPQTPPKRDPQPIYYYSGVGNPFLMECDVSGMRDGAWVSQTGYFIYDSSTGQYVDTSGGAAIPQHLLNRLSTSERNELISFFTQRFPTDRRIHAISG